MGNYTEAQTEADASAPGVGEKAEINRVAIP